MADFRKRRVILFLMMLLDEEERKTINRTQWQRKWLQRREVMGAYHSIFMELAVEDTPKFFEFIRMSYPKFLELVNLIGPSITRENTHLRSTIPPGERLALTLRYLATGESFSSTLSEHCQQRLQCFRDYIFFWFLSHKSGFSL